MGPSFPDFVSSLGKHFQPHLDLEGCISPQDLGLVESQDMWERVVQHYVP